MKAKLNPIVAAGLFLLIAQPLQASVDSMLSISLKCYYQQTFSTPGDKIIGHVDAVRIDSKQLLSLLEKELMVKFPRGAQLKVATDGKVYVTDSKAVVITDVSTYLHATMDDGVRLLDGSRNLATGQEDTRNYYPIILTMNFSILQGSVKGILSEKLVVHLPDRFGVRLSTGLSSATVDGSGSYNGKAAYFDGALTLHGKTAQ